MYGEFAYIYDKVMESMDYDKWYLFIKKIFEEIEFKGTDIMDMGCGTGEILLRLKKEGYKPLGIDISPEMLLVAKEKFDKLKEDIPLVNQDMLELRLPVEVDAVISLFDTMNYITDYRKLNKVFANINMHLPIGGYFIFDTATRKLMENNFKNGIFCEDRDDITILWNHYYDRKTKLDRIFTSFFVKEKKLYRRIDEIHDKKIYTEEEIEEAGVLNGFEMVKKYKNRELAGDRIFYVFKKIKTGE